MAINKMKILPEYKVTLYCCMIGTCNKTYSTKFNLKRHVEVSHLKQKKHKCPYCEKFLVSQQNLKEHIFVHTGEKPYQCSTCGEFFRQISQLSLHKRDHELPKDAQGCCLESESLISSPLSLAELVIKKIVNYPFF